MKYMLLFLALCSSSCSSPPENIATPPVNVEIAEVQQQEVQEFIEAIGNIYASAIVQIRPQVQGVLIKSYVKEGIDVKEGDLLYEIDPRPYKAALDEAQATLLKDQASLELAKSTVKRYSELVKKDYISALTYEQYGTNAQTAEAQVQLDLASVELAKINLGYTQIKSPLTGRIGNYNIDVGNIVIANDPNAIIEIRRLIPIEVRFSIPQKDFQEVQKYQNKENLTFAAFLPYDDTRTFTGYVFFIDNHIDLQTGTILLKGYYQNEELALWPGEFVRVRIYTKLSPQALVIPFSAIVTGQKGPFVYVVQPDMTVQTVPVTTGQRLNQSIVIQEGLKVGNKVITNGQINLKNGSKIVVKGQLSQ